MHYKLLFILLVSTIASTHSMEIENDIEIATKNKEVYAFCKLQYNYAKTIIPHTQRDLTSLYKYCVDQNNTDFLQWILIISKSSFDDSCMQEAYKHSSTSTMKLFFANYKDAEKKRKAAKGQEYTSTANNGKRNGQNIQLTEQNETIYNIFQEQCTAAQQRIPSIHFTNPDIAHNQHNLTSLLTHGIEQDDVTFIEWVLLIRKPPFDDPCLETYKNSHNPEMRFIFENYIAIEKVKIEAKNKQYIKKEKANLPTNNDGDGACRCIIS